jgi:hypothetical protein
MLCTKCTKDLPLKAFGPDPRKTNGKSSWCRVCKKEYQKQFVRERRKEPKWRAEHNEAARQGRFAWYGLTEADYEEMLALQKGGCAGCGRPPKDNKRLNIDHKHQPQDKKREPWERASHVRGLLCHTCNRALGLLRDNAETLRNLAAYLDHPPAVTVVLPKFQAVTAYLEDYEARKAQQLTEKTADQ